MIGGSAPKPPSCSAEQAQLPQSSGFASATCSGKPSHFRRRRFVVASTLGRRPPKGGLLPREEAPPHRLRRRGAPPPSSAASQPPHPQGGFAPFGLRPDPHLGDLSERSSAPSSPPFALQAHLLHPSPLLCPSGRERGSWAPLLASLVKVPLFRAKLGCFATSLSLYKESPFLAKRGGGPGGGAPWSCSDLILIKLNSILSNQYRCMRFGEAKSAQTGLRPCWASPSCANRENTEQ